MRIQILGGLGVSRKKENSRFICKNCENEVLPLTNGSYRNHCPYCLYSLHLDKNPGDRLSDCHGLMKPEGIIYHSKKGYQVRHKCISCGFERVNKIAENTVVPDNFDLILRLIKQMHVAND